MLIYWFVVGSIVGSFLNVMVERTVSHQNFIVGRSHCSRCRVTLKWYELIPIVSYLIQLGKCRKCKVHLPFHLFYFECTTALTFTLFPPINLSNGKNLCLLLLIQISATFDLLTYHFPLPNSVISLALAVTISSQSFAIIFLEILCYLILIIINQHAHLIGDGDLDLFLILIIAHGILLTNLVILIGSLLAIIYSFIMTKHVIAFVPFIYTALLIVLI